MITLVDAPIRERNAIEGVECWSLEDIPVLRCRKSQRGATSSSAKEIQWRPCSWTEEWPVWGPLTVGENQTCLLSCRPQVTKELVVEGESLMRLSSTILI